MKKFAFQKYKSWLSSCIMILFITTLLSGCGSGGSSSTSSKAITEFSLNGTTGVISGTNIAVLMPYGTSLGNLIATYITTGESVKVNGVVQVNGVTSNDFTNPVVYTVTAADGSTATYTVTVTIAFVAYYPSGCTVNNTGAGIVGTCECIKDPKTNKIWTAVGPNNTVTTGSWNDWTGGLLTAYNNSAHCGLTGGWSLPSAPNASYGYMSPSNPGGDWGDIATAAGMNGSFYAIGTWMNNNGFQSIDTYNFYWSSQSYDVDYAWVMYMGNGYVTSYARTYNDVGVLLVHP
jgi:hypothetical protein